MTDREKVDFAIKELTEIRNSLERCVDGRPGAFLASCHARQLDAVLKELERQ